MTFYFRDSSLKKRKESDVFKVHSRRKLDSYIHHVVSNSLPPTAQVGGAVIKSPRLPLPPIQLPNTTPSIITTPPKKIVPHKQTHQEPVDADKDKVDGSPFQNDSHVSICSSQVNDKNDNNNDVKESHDADENEVDGPLQSNSNSSVGSNEVNQINNSNENSVNIVATNIPSTSTVSSLSPIRTTENFSNSSTATDHSHRQKVKPLKCYKGTATTKSPTKPSKHKKLLSSTLKSLPLADHSASAEYVHSDDKDDELLPVLRGKNTRPSSNFDVVTSLTGQKR